MSDQQPIRVLIVDDEDSFRLPLAERLPRFLPGCTIDAARNGGEALKKANAARGEYDVALIDQVLYPPPDGIEVMRKIRALYPHIQVIIFTGWETEAGLKALRAGAYRYLAKSSFDVEELAFLIQMAVEHQNLIRKGWLAKAVETSSALQGTLELEQVLSTILKGIQDLGYDRVRLYLLSEDGQILMGSMQVGGPAGFGSISRPLDRDTYAQATLKAKAPRIYRRGDLGPDPWETALEKEDVEEWVDIPLIAEDKPIGKLSIDNKISQNKIAPDELAPLMVFANHAAGAIHNARIHEQTRRGLANLTRLYEASSHIATSLDPDETVKAILNSAVAAGQAHSASLCLVGPDGRLVSRMAVGYSDEVFKNTQPRPDGISVKVMGTQEPFLVADIAELRDGGHPGMLAADFKAAICLPLLSKDEPIGVMWVNYVEPHSFPKREVRLLQTFANQAAIAIGNARLHQEAESRIEQLVILNQIGRDLVSSLELERVPHAIMERATKALGVEAGSIMLRDAEELVIQDAVGPVTGIVRGIRLPLTQGIAGWVASNGESLMVLNVQEDPRFCPGFDAATGFNTRSLLAVPIKVKTEVVGVIEAVNKISGDFNRVDLELLSSIALTAGIAIENARLFSEVKRNSERLEQYERNMAAVQHASAAIGSTQKLDALLSAACQQVVDLFGVDHSGLVRFNESQQHGTVVAEYPNRGAIGIQIPVDDAPLEEQLIVSKALFNIPDVAAESQLGPVKDILLDFGIQSIMVVPIVFRDRVIGSFSLDAIGQQRHFSDEEIKLCQIIAAQLAVAIDNADLLARQERSLAALRTFHSTLDVLLTTPEKAESVLDSIAESLYREFGLATCTIGFLDELEGNLEFRVHKGLLGPVTRRVEDMPQDLWIQLRNGNERVCVPLVERPDLAKLLVAPGLEEFAALPLRGRDRFFGIVTMSSKGKLDLKEEDWDLVQGLVGQAALALENAERYQREQERARRWETVADAGRKMSRLLGSSPKKLLAIIAEAACQIVGAHCAVIYPYYVATKTFDTENYASYGLWQPGFLLKDKPRVSAGWASQIIHQGEITIEDLSQEAPEYATQNRFFRDEGVNAFFGKRLDAAEQPVGVLYVNFRQPHTWTQDELSAIRPFADQAALTIEYALLQGKRNSALQGIIESGQAITSTLELRPLLEKIVATAKAALQADMITLHPYNQDVREFGPEYVRIGIKDSDTAEWSPKSSETAEKVLASNEVHFADQSVSHSILGSDFVSRQGIESSAGLPLKVVSEVVGVMFINYRAPHHFAAEEQGIIRMFANEAALAIHNARLFDRLKKGQRRLQTVVDMSRAFSSSLELDQVIATLLDSLETPFPQANSRKVLLYDRYADQLIIHPTSHKHYWSDAKAAEILKPIPTSMSIGGWVVRRKKPLNVPDVSQDSRYLELIPETRSQLSAPVMFGEDVIGVLTLESRQLAAFSDEDQRLLLGLADQAGVAIENARRYQEIEARTALAWMGVAGATWFHSIRGNAATIKDWLFLVREKLSDTGALASVIGDFDTMDVEMEKLLEIPTRGVLPTKNELKLVPVNKLLRNVTERLCQPRQDVQLDFDLHGGDGLIALADSHWLAIAIEYLVKNALQAVGDGGRLRVETQEEPGRILIRLADTGPGIPERLRPKIFKQPLTREDGVNGSGVGLLIVKMIIDACRGDITFESAAGVGTTFVIWLQKVAVDEQIVR